MTVTLPIHTVSEANMRQHWAKRAKRRCRWSYKQRQGKPRQYAVEIQMSQFGEIETAVDEIDEWKDVVP